MANPRLLALLLVAILLALSFSQGAVEGRKVAVGHYGRSWPRSPLYSVAKLQQQQQGAGGAAGMVSTVMDYAEPKANTNPHTGVPATPSDPTSPPAH